MVDEKFDKLFIATYFVLLHLYHFVYKHSRSDSELSRSLSLIELSIVIYLFI